MQTLSELIRQELLERQQNQQQAIIELDSRKEKIIQLINQHCQVNPASCISREEWQDFCFQQLFDRTCHTNIPFSIYLNQLMPELGFPLGYAHTKLHVYRGLKWKKKSSE